MPDLSQLARRSPTVFPKAAGPRCLFCGSGQPWYDLNERQPGCGCEWARQIRAGKLDFQMFRRVESGKLVITKCSPVLWAPLIETGIAVGAYRAVLGKELPEASRQAMRDAVAAYQARFAKTQDKPDGFAKTPAPRQVSESMSVTESVSESGAVCAVCGKRFVPRRSTAKYCSDACRAKAQR